MAVIRLNKYLASLGIASRRSIDQLIRAGKISVNGQSAQLGQKIDPSKDQIKVDGQLVKSKEPPNLVYFALNKPMGVVSTSRDPYGRTTVLLLIKKNFPNLKQRVYPVGRLDEESEGLILLTNDGDLTYRLTHPKYKVNKRYMVWLSHKISQAEIDQLQAGVELEEGITAPAKIEVLQRSRHKMLLEMTIHQGWNRQIRRMMGKFNTSVEFLKRIAHGPIKLGQLGEGKARVLTKQEINSLLIQTKSITDITFSKLIIGPRVNHIWRGYAGVIFLELGKIIKELRHSTKGDYYAQIGDFTLMIEGRWLLKRHNQVLVDINQDDYQAIDQMITKLLNKQIVKLDFNKLKDKVIFYFNNKYSLEMPNFSRQRLTIFKRKKIIFEWGD